MTAETGVLVAGVGALLAIDHAASVSLLLSQPLVAAALCGAVLGHFEAAVVAGLFVQLVWMVPLPVGGARLPEAWLGGLAAAAAVPVELPRGWVVAGFGLAPAVVVGVAAALLAAPLLGLQRHWHEVRAGRAFERIARGDLTAASRLQWGALGLHALRGAVLATVVARVAPNAAAALSPFSSSIGIGWLALPLAVIALGRSSAPRRRVPWWIAGVVVGAAFAWWEVRS